MLWRVKDILPVIAPHLGGNGLDLACGGGPAAREALEAYNRINEIFMNRHDWPGTELDICLSLPDGFLTLPARFESIKALSFDGMPGVRILPAGWEYLENGPGLMRDSCFPIEALQLIGRQFPTYRDLPRPMAVGVFSSAPEQDGMMIRLHGLDAGGRDLRSPDGSAGWMLPISYGNPDNRPFITPQPVSLLTAISKPITKGHVDVFGWCGQQMHWLSRLDPRETSPGYSRYRMAGAPCRQAQAQARVSLAYRELWDLEEVSLVQHREAYRLAAQAISALDDMDGARGSEFMNRSVKMLKDRVAKLEQGQRKGLSINMTHRRPLRSPWRYSTR